LEGAVDTTATLKILASRLTSKGRKKKKREENMRRIYWLFTLKQSPHGKEDSSVTSLNRTEEAYESGFVNS